MIYHHCYGKSYNRKNDENLPKFRNVLYDLSLGDVTLLALIT